VYREFLIKEPGELGDQAQHVSSHTGKMRKIGSTESDSCPRMIRKLGCIPRTLSATWSAMQICPTRSAAPGASA
jgi:hypothetical protein